MIERIIRRNLHGGYYRNAVRFPYLSHELELARHICSILNGEGQVTDEFKTKFPNLIHDAENHAKHKRVWNSRLFEKFNIFKADCKSYLEYCISRPTSKEEFEALFDKAWNDAYQEGYEPVFDAFLERINATSNGKLYSDRVNTNGYTRQKEEEKAYDL